MDYSNIFRHGIYTNGQRPNDIQKCSNQSCYDFLGFHSKKKGSVPEKWLVENSWGEDTGKKDVM